MLKKNDITTGLIVSIGSIALGAIIIYCIMLAMGFTFSTLNKKIFLLAFAPNVLFMRYYFKTLHYTKTANTIIIVLFTIMIPFIVYLLKTSQIHISTL